ncbi:hypothetical protein HK100_010885, partial [Physocladia obscura]
MTKLLFDDLANCNEEDRKNLTAITKSEVTVPAQLPKEVQLTVFVAMKVNDIVNHWNGLYAGDVCEWLFPKYTFKYGKAVDDIQLAAMFLETSNDDTLVSFLDQKQ